MDFLAVLNQVGQTIATFSILEMQHSPKMVCNFHQFRLAKNTINKALFFRDVAISAKKSKETTLLMQKTCNKSKGNLKCNQKENKTK